MALYRIYIDEVGNHDLAHVDEDNHRFFSLTGVILESSYVSTVLQPEMESLKREFFLQDPDEPIVFHRKELVNRRYPFHRLRNLEVEKQFNQRLLQALARWEYVVITVVLDKKAHLARYGELSYHPYHYALTVLLERFILFLNASDQRGDVMVESRGGKVDMELRRTFAGLYTNGTENVRPELWQRLLTSKELKLKPKIANIAGLQLADLIAHPSRRDILLERSLLLDDRDVFGDRVCAILRAVKYRRNPSTGVTWGYGKVLLPK